MRIKKEAGSIHRKKLTPILKRPQIPALDNFGGWTSMKKPAASLSSRESQSNDNAGDVKRTRKMPVIKTLIVSSLMIGCFALGGIIISPSPFYNNESATLNMMASNPERLAMMLNEIKVGE